MLPSYRWLEQSHCIGADAFETGWKALIEGLLARIDVALGASSARLHVLQVKEKFGALRFYYQLADGTADQQAEIEALVRSSADGSMRTCFECGQSAEMRKVDGWIVPQCDQHFHRC